MPQERFHERVVEQTVGFLVLLLKEEFVEVAEEVVVLVPLGRVPQRTVEHAPVPQFLKETSEVKCVPQERVQQPIVEMPLPQISKETVEAEEVATHANC